MTLQTLVNNLLRTFKKRIMTKLYNLLLLLALCPIALNAQLEINGDITFPNGLPICNALVELQNANGDILAQDLSEADGTFTLSDLPAGTDYTLHFSKDGNPLNGTSTFDLVLIARRILGIDPLQDYDVWIADVNGSGTLTTLDMVFIRRLILSIDTEFPVSTWAFDEPQASAPDNQISIASLTEDLSIDVIGVKRGDLNGSAQVNCD